MDTTDIAIVVWFLIGIVLLVLLAYAFWRIGDLQRDLHDLAEKVRDGHD